LPLESKRALIDPDQANLSVVRQCELLGLARSSRYYRPRQVTGLDLELMRIIDEQYTLTPFYGIRRMTACLHQQGHSVNRKRVQRLMRLMGLEAIYPKPRLSKKDDQHKVFPYLLRGLAIERPNQVWASDITYIRLRRGFVYLVAVMDWFSRYVLSWSISVTMDVHFCLEALGNALEKGKPEIFNTDQGAQFTSREFTGLVQQAGARISMDGKGRVFDNIFVERLWRSVKYEEVYIKDYADVLACIEGLRGWFLLYNNQRPHQALGYRTPSQVYLSQA
jgi:putative transposase